VPWLVLEISRNLDWLIFNYVFDSSLLTLLRCGTVSYVIKAIGVSLLVFGIIIFIQTWVELARAGNFFPLLTISRRHLGPEKLVTTGLYNQVRHPMFLAYAAMLTGLSLWFSSIFAVAWVVLLVVLIGITVLIDTEERELYLWFGEEYREYQKVTPVFFPRLFHTKSHPKFGEQGK